jgi:hypothetical protein
MKTADLSFRTTIAKARTFPSAKIRVKASRANSEAI